MDPRDLAALFSTLPGTMPEAARGPWVDQASPHASQLPGIYGLKPEDRSPSMDPARPNARAISGSSPGNQKPESAICVDLAISGARHLPGLSLFGQRPEKRSPFLSLATPTARETSGMSAIAGQKPDGRAAGPMGGLVIFKDLSR